MAKALPTPAQLTTAPRIKALYLKNKDGFATWVASWSTKLLVKACATLKVPQKKGTPDIDLVEAIINKVRNTWAPDDPGLEIPSKPDIALPDQGTSDPSGSGEVSDQQDTIAQIVDQPVEATSVDQPEVPQNVVTVRADTIKVVPVVSDSTDIVAQDDQDAVPVIAETDKETKEPSPDENEAIKIMVSPRIHALVPEPSDEEFERLCQSIKDNGFLSGKEIELLDDGTGTIVDGHSRARALEHLDIPITSKHVKYVHIEPDAVERYVWMMNIARRHLPDVKRIELARKYIDGVKGAANNRKKEHRGSGERRKEIADLAGTSDIQVARVERLRQQWPELYDSVSKGEMAVGAAHEQLAKAIVKLTAVAPELVEQIKEGHLSAGEALRLKKPDIAKWEAEQEAKQVTAKPPNDSKGESSDPPVSSKKGGPVTAALKGVLKEFQRHEWEVKIEKPEERGAACAAVSAAARSFQDWLIKQIALSEKAKV